MNKRETWEQAQKILADLGLSKAKLNESLIQFEKLLAPKKGSTKIPPKVIDGVEYYYCRFTGLYYPSSEMIYQNDEKRAAGEHKGYSRIGISLWNKGQKYLKEIKFKSVEIAYGDDQSDEAQAEGLKLHKEAQEITKNNLTNDYKWLMDNFLTDEQADELEGLELPTV